MKIYKSNEIKNISLLGSSGSGKTTLVEAMLYESGSIKRRGSIDAENTVSDYYIVEHEYGYSVFPTVLHVEYLGKKLNIIDCPGSEDFIGGTITALNVTDLAMILINTQYGVEVGTINQFRYTTKTNIPVIFVANQIYTEKSDFNVTVEQLKESFGKKVTVIQYPVERTDDKYAIIDVLLMKMYVWEPEGGDPKIEKIPKNEIEKASQLHNTLVENAAENDEALMNLYFDKGSLTEDEMREGIHKGLIARDIFPIFCVDSAKCLGNRRLMEFLGNVVPFTSDMKAPVTINHEEVKPDSNGPTSLFVFRTSIEPHIGEVTYFKVMSGVVHEGDDLMNISRHNAKERISQLYSVSGSNRTEVEELRAGDIGATVKLKDTRTGNTLNAKGCEFEFPQIQYPDSKYRRVIHAKNKGDNEKLGFVLQRMHEEDPTWIIEQSKELKETIIHGQGEFHLRTLKWRIENIDKIPVEYSVPRIPYRETITKQSSAEYKHKKQSGGSGQFGAVQLIVEPYVEGQEVPQYYNVDGREIKISVRGTEEITLEWGGKLIIINSIVGGAIDARFLPAITKGIMSRMEQGPLTGSYARDVRVLIYDGKMHPVDSNEISFQLAARHAFAEAFRKAGPKLLEPIYEVRVFTPASCMGDIMSDLQGRRGVIMGMESAKGQETITAKVPLSELSDYSTVISSVSGGRAAFNMRFDAYELVPGEVQKKLLEDYQKGQNEE